MPLRKWFWKKKDDVSPPPAFWRDYQKLMSTKVDRRLPVDQVDFVVFDTETTGLDVRKDRILSIGALRVRDREINIGQSFEYLIQQPRQKAKAESIPIHGILPVERPGSLSEPEALARFIGYTGSAVLVGHHVRFDIEMINRALGRMGLGKLKNPYIDTARLAKRTRGLHHPGPKKTPGLDELCQRYRIPPVDRHTAAGDAYLTALLLLKLMARLQDRGVRNLGDLLR